MADTLVEERDDVMHPPGGGNPTLRKAHFLKPIFDQRHKDLPPPPCSLFSSKPTCEKRTRHLISSYKSSPSEEWKIWVDNLKPRWKEIWKQAGIYQAILASTYTFPKDKDLIIGLAERWCADTNTFILPWGEVSITLEDVIFLGNFSVLGASFFTPVDDEYVYILDGLKNVHKKCGRKSGRLVKGSVWMKYFMCRGNQLEHEAFLAMWLSKFVLVSSFDHIAVRNFHAAIHLSRGNRIALAPLVLASIYRDMRLLHNSIVEPGVYLRFSICHVDLLHMWAWERFPNLRPTPSVMERGEPRSARWNGVKIIKVKDVRAALDSAKESFMWRPYSITSSDSTWSNLYRDNEQWVVVDSDDTESYARCLNVSWLVGSGHIEQYLPHRVAMQFGYDQDVPPCVVRSNQSPETAWCSYNRPIRGTKLYIPPRLFESDVSSRYMVWWRGSLAVNEETLTSCMSDVKSLATPGCSEERSEDHVDEDNIPIAQLMSQSRKTKNSGKRSDLDNEPILNNYYGAETRTNSICMAEHVESSVQSMSASEVAQVELKTLDAPGCPSGFVEGRLQDSLTITQLLIQSKNKGCSGKTGGGGGGGDDELVLNTDSEEVAVVSKTWKCANESMELTKQNMSSSGKRNKSNSSTGNLIDIEEDAVVHKNIALANEEVVSKASCPEHNIVNTEEESSDNTTSELPQLDLEARIGRLEKIFDIIKAENLAARFRKI